MKEWPVAGVKPTRVGVSGAKRILDSDARSLADALADGQFISDAIGGGPTEGGAIKPLLLIIVQQN